MINSNKYDILGVVLNMQPVLFVTHDVIDMVYVFGSDLSTSEVHLQTPDLETLHSLFFYFEKYVDYVVNWGRNRQEPLIFANRVVLLQFFVDVAQIFNIVDFIWIVVEYSKQEIFEKPDKSDSFLYCDGIDHNRKISRLDIVLIENKIWLRKNDEHWLWLRW